MHLGYVLRSVVIDSPRPVHSEIVSRLSFYVARRLLQANAALLEFLNEFIDFAVRRALVKALHFDESSFQTALSKHLMVEIRPAPLFMGTYTSAEWEINGAAMGYTLPKLT